MIYVIKPQKVFIMTSPPPPPPHRLSPIYALFAEIKLLNL